MDSAIERIAKQRIFKMSALFQIFRRRGLVVLGTVLFFSFGFEGNWFSGYIEGCEKAFDLEMTGLFECIDLAFAIGDEAHRDTLYAAGAQVITA